MATSLIATGDTAANSTDITVTTDPITIFISPADAKDYVVEIQFKNSANAYITFSTLTRPELTTVLSAPGVYRVRRVSGNLLVDRS